MRKLFIPDPRYTLFDADLSGADAQVVAWEAEDEDLKSAFRAGLKIHVKNARDMFPDKVKGWSNDAIKDTDRPGGIYYDNKRAVHGTNYGLSPRGMAQALGWMVAECENFQRRWFGLHPGIRNKFHEGVRHSLANNRTIYNAFGFRRVYFDRIDACFTEGLAWKPQSTVALNTYHGAFALEAKYPFVEILLQVHDNLVFQMPTDKIPPYDEIRNTLAVVTPYPDPLTIPWGLSASTKSWGEVQKV